MKGGKVEKYVNWNMIKSFEPPTYQVGDLVTYKYKPAVIQKVYLRDDTYSLQYEGDRKWNIVGENDKKKDDYIGRVKWIYLEKRKDTAYVNKKRSDKDTRQEESNSMGCINIGDVVEYGFRGSRKIGIVAKAHRNSTIDNDDEVLYHIEGEDGVMNSNICGRYVRKFQPKVFEVNDFVRMRKESSMGNAVDNEVEYEEGIVTKVHSNKNTYDVKVIEAEFIAHWIQGDEYKQKQWGRKSSPFDRKLREASLDTPGVNFDDSLFDDSFVSTTGRSHRAPSPSLSSTSPSALMTKLLPSGSLFTDSPSSSSTSLAPSPPPSSLSLNHMHDFSLASSYIPYKQYQDSKNFEGNIYYKR